jgi:hypothetical protein
MWSYIHNEVLALQLSLAATAHRGAVAWSWMLSLPAGFLCKKCAATYVFRNLLLHLRMQALVPAGHQTRCNGWQLGPQDCADNEPSPPCS